MCEPVSATAGTATFLGMTSSQLVIASMAMSAAMAAAQFAQQSQAASAQAEYQNAQATAREEQMTANTKLAMDSYFLNSGLVNDQLQQKDEEASRDAFSKRIEGEQGRSTARVAAAESGVAGLSVNALLDDFWRQEGRYTDTIKVNNEFDHKQASIEKQGLRATAEGRVQSVTPFVREPINSPSILAGALGIGSGALDRYSRYKAIERSGKV